MWPIMMLGRVVLLCHTGGRAFYVIMEVLFGILLTFPIVRFYLWDLFADSSSSVRMWPSLLRSEI